MPWKKGEENKSPSGGRREKELFGTEGSEDRKRSGRGEDEGYDRGEEGFEAN